MPRGLNAIWRCSSSSSGGGMVSFGLVWSRKVLDIRYRNNLKFLKSPNLKIVNKEVVQVDFLEEDEDRFVKKLLNSFNGAPITVLFILDNFHAVHFSQSEFSWESQHMMDSGDETTGSSTPILEN